MSLLVASENPDQLYALSQLLEHHTPHTAATVADVERLANELNSLDALLCDYDFSVADGRMVALALRRKFPKLQVAYIAEAMDVEADGDLVFGPETTPEGLTAWVQAVSPAAAAPRRPIPAPAAVDPLRRPTTLLGLTLGDYDIREKRRDLEVTESYLAWQQSMGRFVVLERLKAEYLDEEAYKRNFRGLVRARANVAHASIASVYEAQETRTGDIFYTRERVQGTTLEDLLETKQQVRQEPLLRLLHCLGQTMTYYAERNIPREPAQPYHFYLGDDGLPRAGNLALPQPFQIDEPAEITEVAGWLARVSEPTHPTAALPLLLRRMNPNTPDRLHTWRDVGAAAKAALDQLATVQADQASTLSPHSTRAGRKKPWLAILGSAAVAATVAGVLARRSGPETKPLEDLPSIRIPATTLADRKTTLPSFEIDRNEVSIGQYAEFLKSTANQTKFNHPDQPATKQGHQPLKWAEYFPLATEGAAYDGIPISLRSPVLYADWWDAYAYAAWKGRRLPTDAEWQMAARSEAAQPYPWGAQPDPKAANTGDDYPASASAPGGQVDGYAFWCDVDALAQDRSPYGVHGLAGNVSEWTATWDQHPSLPDKKAPVLCGGSFLKKSAPVDKLRWVSEGAETAQPHIGFRTVASTQTRD